MIRGSWVTPPLWMVMVAAVVAEFLLAPFVVQPVAPPPPLWCGGWWLDFAIFHAKTKENRNAHKSPHPALVLESILPIMPLRASFGEFCETFAQNAIENICWCPAAPPVVWRLVASIEHFTRENDEKLQCTQMS